MLWLIYRQTQLSADAVLLGFTTKITLITMASSPFVEEMPGNWFRLDTGVRERESDSKGTMIGRRGSRDSLKITNTAGHQRNRKCCLSGWLKRQRKQKRRQCLLSTLNNQTKKTAWAAKSKEMKPNPSFQSSRTAGSKERIGWCWYTPHRPSYLRACLDRSRRTTQSAPFLPRLSRCVRISTQHGDEAQWLSNLLPGRSSWQFS